MKSFRNVSDPNVHHRITRTDMHKINKSELCGIILSREVTPCLLNLLLDFFANLVFPDNVLALFHPHCRLAAVTQLDKTALIFSSPGALLLQKQTHLMSTQLLLANSPAVQKNQAVM